MKRTGNVTLKATLLRGYGLTVDLSAKTAEGLPKRMKVLNWGENPNARGKRVYVGKKLLAALSAPAYPFRKIPLDYEHNTLAGTPAHAESQEPRRVAGFATVECIEGEGVFLNVEAWTPDGIANAANYCDLSAAAVTDAAGEVCMIPSAALCRCGAVEGMDFCQVSLSLSAALVPLGITNPLEDQGMNWKEMVAKALGMDPATASDEEVATALAAALKKPEPIDLSAALKPVQDSVTALSAQFTAELEKRDKQSVLERAAREGKVVALSADALAKLNAADLTAHVAGLAATVPLAAKTPETLPADGRAATPTEAQRAIALNCGMDPEKVFTK